MAAGISVAFWSQDCRFPDGGKTYQADYNSFLVGSGKTTSTDLNFNARASDSRCFGGYNETIPVVIDVITYHAPAAETYWPASRMAAGVGLVAVGALLATVWADVPDVQLDLQPGGARLSKTFGF